jgi:plastocyanin
MRYLQICISIGLVLCVFVTRVDAQSVENGDTLVVLGKDGFTPASVRVPVGATVTFQTDRGRYFWPASDTHPSHAIYPAFDPGRPINPNDTWSFTFDAAGRWTFHDHISPYFAGVIEVVGESSQESPKTSIRSYLDQGISFLRNFIAQNTAMLNLSTCRKPELDRSHRIECWERVVVSLVQRRGVKAALAFVSREKDRNTAFAADCHIYVHRVGEEYYWKYIGDKRIEVSDAFDICEYGFFHGFMQEFTSHGQQIVEAKLYCDRLLEHVRKKDTVSTLSLQCYHGIGHGLAYLYAPEMWGDNEEIMRRGVADCRELFIEPRFCISGVYGGMAAMHWGMHGFTLVMDKNDPFALCKNQKKPERLDCYDQLVPALFSEMGLNLQKAGRFIEAIEDEEMAGFLMHHLGSMPSYTLVPNTKDFSSIVVDCRTFRQSLHMQCLGGFVAALVRIGTVEQGIQRATEFCEHAVLTNEEQTACFEHAYERLLWGNDEKIQGQFCSYVRDRHGIELCDIHE